MNHPVPAELRRVTVLADLADDDLTWIAERCDIVERAAGEMMFPPGAPADAMFLMLAGTLEVQRQANPGAPPIIVRAGEITGMLPFSRLTHFNAIARATTDLRAARYPQTAFDDLLRHIPVLEPRLVAVLSDRVRDTMRRDQQAEKMSALGRLSAGLAHELNNPASAARRAAAEARRRGADVMALASELAASEAPNVMAALDDVRRRARADGSDPLERADREDALSDWIRVIAPDHDAWSIAAGLADAGLAPDDLGPPLDEVPDALKGPALAWLEASLALDASLATIEHATTRIGELVAAVKDYTHMDRANVLEPVDVRSAIDGALMLLGHRMRDCHVAIARDLPEDLPRVRGLVGELNQVWTNLVDNAIDAASEVPDGRVTIRAWRDGASVAIDVADTGPGVPEAIRDRIWEPFFTTKDVGQGTGLGLDIVRHIIVDRHGGAVALDSRPGETHFTVRLPVA